jgi:hypothetical protein
VTEVRDHFPEIDGLSIDALHSLREEMHGRCAGNWSSLSDEDLARLVQITRCLRKKAAAPGGAPRATKKKEPATLDDLI